MLLKEKKANLFIVGAMKSATTSLYFHLKEHPDVFLCEPKEPNFFCNQELRHCSVGSHAKKIHIVDDLENYQALYEDVKGEKIIGEASVSYLYFKKSAERIKSYNPNSKVIIILRKPWDRAYSAYKHLVREGDEVLSFRESLDLEDIRIIQQYPPIFHFKKVGLYYEQVTHFIKVFGRKKVLLVDYDRYQIDINSQLKAIYTFLGIDSDFIPNDVNFRYNSSELYDSKFQHIRKVGSLKFVKKMFNFILPLSYKNKQIIAAKFHSLFSKKSVSDNSFLEDYFKEDWLKTKQLIIGQRIES